MRERVKNGAMSVTAVIMKGPLSYLIVVLVTQCLNFTSLCGGDILDRHNCQIYLLNISTRQN